jgi:hypothetical protein
LLRTNDNGAVRDGLRQLFDTVQERAAA